MSIVLVNVLAETVLVEISCWLPNVTTCPEHDVSPTSSLKGVLFGAVYVSFSIELLGGMKSWIGSRLQVHQYRQYCEYLQDAIPTVGHNRTCSQKLHSAQKPIKNAVVLLISYVVRFSPSACFLPLFH
jgi:hypothetical protein